MSGNLLAATEAILTAAFAGYDPPVEIHQGKVTGDTTIPARRFVIITPLTAKKVAETYRARADMRRTGVRVTITCTLQGDSSGSVTDEADWLARRTENALDGVRPDVDGARYTVLRHDHTEYMGEDEDLKAAQSAYLVADFLCTALT